jgi:hypothetical protein
VAPVLNSRWVSGYPITWPSPQDQWDMAFELGTASQPAKHVQSPDLAPTGLDVNATRSPFVGGPYILADDFLCTSTGPIRQIVVYGSWYRDRLPGMPPDPSAVVFTLSLHADSGVAPIPGPVLWWRDFAPGQFTVEPIMGLQEGWLDPPTNFDPMGDTICWRYTFNLEPGEFIQQGTPQQPVVYWLDVQAHPLESGTALFGWKTSLEHWGSPAVWAFGSEPAPGPWSPLSYPPGHPLGGPIDLAFEIVGQGLHAIKWSQPPLHFVPPNTFNGWDQLSVYGTQIAADDWRCDSPQPVTDIRWWGSFVGWTEPTPPPEGMPPQFHLAIWTDVPAGPGLFSHPGQVIWEAYVSNYSWEFFGWDLDPRTGNIESVFVFNCHLNREQWFWQGAGDNIYWLSIAAVYSLPPPPYQWGWLTRPRVDSLAPDDAVCILDPAAPSLGSEFVSGYPLEFPPGRSWDLAFELISAPPPSEYPKWEQPPFPHPLGYFYGWNELSHYYYPQIAADDWFCLGPHPVTDIHWWGSYLNWMEPTPPLEGPDGFHLGIWTDVPAGPGQPWSHPGQLIWESFVPRAALNERAVGIDFHEEHGYETCFAYDYYLPPEQWFFQPPTGHGTIYWLSIAAVYPVITPPYQWGWKTTIPSWRDAAVRIFAPVPPQIGQEFESGEPIYDSAGTPWDLAFVLTTNEPLPQWACCLPDGSCVNIEAPRCVRDLGGTVVYHLSCEMISPYLLRRPPEWQWICEKRTLRLEVQACGLAPLSYQWWHNGLPIGGNSPVLVIENVGPNNAGEYSITVTDALGNGRTFGPFGVDVWRMADSNCDGIINAFDIDAFVIALTNRPLWEATYPCDYLCANDINRDDLVNAFDIDPFVECLINAGCP